MDYILFNKYMPICRLTMDEDGQVDDIVEIYNEAYAPVGVRLNSRNSVYEWWRGRSIPASREGLDMLLAQLGYSSRNTLALKAFGLSLSDQYWIRPVGSDLEWDKINFFQNDFSIDVGQAFFDHKSMSRNINLLSPDNTSDGWLKKKWIMKNDQRYLVKASSKPFKQEPYNEVIASKLARLLGMDNFVEYGFYVDERQGVCSICPNFINSDTELVPAYYLCRAVEQRAEASLYERLAHVCTKLDVPDWQRDIDNMLVLDYILANTDRHLNNFGAIRDVNTLKFIGMAPVFDSGTSLWHNIAIQDVGCSVPAQPFYYSHEEQLELVRNWSCYDFSRLDNLKQDLLEILLYNESLSSEKAQAIIEAVQERVQAISLYQSCQTCADATEQHRLALPSLHSFKRNLEPVYYYYRRLITGSRIDEYNPWLDKNICQKMLEDGFVKEKVSQAILLSPYIAGDKMAEAVVATAKDASK